MSRFFEFTFPSHNGRDQVYAWKYLPLGQPRAVVQLMHGFCEHSRRYLHMISAFTQAGFAVYCDDHIGHGKTGVMNHALGDSHAGGFETYLRDEKTLHDRAVSDYPDLPFLVFGHSWGSMLARGYAALYGGDIAALMLCGVVAQWHSCERAYEDAAMRAAYESEPARSAGEWFGRVFENMNARIDDPVNGSAWLACDSRVVLDHGADPYNAPATTLELLWDLVALNHFIGQDDWAQRVPKHIPVYITGGDQDPVGNYGEGLYHVANQLARTGHRTAVRVYPGYRHEIHNEPALQDEVEKSLLRFMNEALDELVTKKKGE